MELHRTFDEHPVLLLNHLYEALAGVPVELQRVKLTDIVEHGVPTDIDVLFNAGTAGDKWSGGEIWMDTRLKAAENRVVSEGCGLFGVREPRAVDEGMRYFQTADILGVDREIGRTICRGKYSCEVTQEHFIMRYTTVFWSFITPQAAYMH